jgi:hypothetical protein
MLTACTLERRAMLVISRPTDTNIGRAADAETVRLADDTAAALSYGRSQEQSAREDPE